MKIKYGDDTYEVTPYLDENRIGKQTMIESPNGLIPFNPKLRDGFDDTPNEIRPGEETSDWWGVPFIIESKDEQGDRFSVRCLDGGAWDRSTCYGWVSTLDEAIELAINGPKWRR